MRRVGVVATFCLGAGALWLGGLRAQEPPPGKLELRAASVPAIKALTPDEGASTVLASGLYDYTPILHFFDVPTGTKLRQPTPDEMKTLGPLWPQVAWHQNAAYYYARAAHLARKVEEILDAPSGSLAVEGAYLGDRVALEQWVEANREALTAMKDGLPLKVCQLPVLLVRLPAPDGQLMPEQMQIPMAILAAVRQLARLCADAAFVEELRGRHDAAAEWYLRGLRMGSQFYGDGALVQCLVGAALISLDSDGLDRLMANQALSDETLRRVIAECRAAEALPEDLARIWRCDAGMQTWLLEALRDEKDWRAFWRAEREGLGWMEGFPLDVRENPRKAVPDRETFMKALPQAQRFVGELLLRPLCDLVSPKRGLKEMLEDEASKGGEPRVYLKIWGPLLESLANRWCRTELILRATQLRAALVLFERQKGKPADKLDQLVPDYLPIVPEDPFFKAPLRYEKTKDGWRIWSIGQDQKDDGGVLAVAERPWDGPEYVFASGLKSNARKRGPRN